MLPNNYAQRCSLLVLSPLPGNTGTVYVGNKAMVRGTGVGVGSELPKGFPAFQIGPEVDFDATTLYLDADTAGDGITGWVQVE